MVTRWTADVFSSCIVALRGGDHHVISISHRVRPVEFVVEKHVEINGARTCYDVEIVLDGFDSEDVPLDIVLSNRVDLGLRARRLTPRRGGAEVATLESTFVLARRCRVVDGGSGRDDGGYQC